jgi:hypothetical protein
LEKDDDLALKRIRLSILDIEACIVTDSGSLVQRMEMMYPRFLSRIENVDAAAHLTCRVLVKKGERDRVPGIWLNGRSLGINPGIDLETIAPDLVLNAVLKKVRSYFMIHASVIAKGSKGVLIAADSGGGKTTLALELVQRGFKFLSDEIAPISRSDGLVHPFPRALNLRPGTLALLGIESYPQGNPTLLPFTTCDIEALMPASLGEACQIGQIIILKPGGSHGDDSSSELEFGLLLDREDEGILSFALDLEGVQWAGWGKAAGLPLLKLRSDRRRQVLSMLEKECSERGIPVLDIHRRPLARPSFAGPARLQAIPKTQAVMDLLRQFQAGHESVLLREEFGGSPRRLFLELVNLIENASCFCLTPGSLAQMADLVEEQVIGG